MTSLYDDVTTITYDYLGPAADRFVARQVRNHFQKDPSQLQPKDLQRLINWIAIAMRLANNDTKTIDNYVACLEALAQPKKPITHGKKISY